MNKRRIHTQLMSEISDELTAILTTTWWLKLETVSKETNSVKV
jgi:hypothetical protein